VRAGCHDAPAGERAGARKIAFGDRHGSCLKRQSIMVVNAVAKPAFLVVGIGASAGGLDALERFFDALPNDTGMAFVVIQHLSPAFKSLTDSFVEKTSPV